MEYLIRDQYLSEDIKHGYIENVSTYVYCTHTNAAPTIDDT